MSRLIDKEVLKSNIRDAFPNLRDRILINNVINEQTTFKLIYCQDCKYYHLWEGEDYGHCEGEWNDNDGLELDDYCSYAVKKEDTDEL